MRRDRRLTKSSSSRGILVVDCRPHQPVSSFTCHFVRVTLKSISRNSFYTWATDFYGHNDMDMVSESTYINVPSPHIYIAGSVSNIAGVLLSIVHVDLQREWRSIVR